MGLLERIKSSYVYTNWKIGRYTRRRRSLVPQFDQRDASFYSRNYHEGEYLHQDTLREQMSREVYLGSAGVFGSTTQSIAEESEDGLHERNEWGWSNNETRTKPFRRGRGIASIPASEGAPTRSPISRDERRVYFPGEIRCSEAYNTTW